MKEQDDIDHLFRSEFDDFAVAPPASVKEAVDLSIASAKRKKFLRWFYLGLALVLILFVTGISLLDYNRKDEYIAKANGQSVSTEAANDNRNQSASAQAGKTTGKTQNSGVTAETSDAKKSRSDASKLTGSNDDRSGNAAPASSLSQRAESGKTKQGNGVAGSSRNHGKSTQNSKVDQRANSAKSTKTKQSGQTGKSGRSGLLAGGTIAGSDGAANGRESKGSSNGDQGNAGIQTAGDGQSSTQGEKQPEKPASTETPPVANAKTEEKPVKDTLTPYVDDDSTAFAKNERAREEAAKKKSLLFSLKPGTTVGFNQRKDTASQTLLKERGSFFIQAEASYFFTPNMGITSGLNYETRKEELSQPSTGIDSVIVGYQYEYIFDSLMNPIDSIQVPMYETQEVAITQIGNYTLYSVGLPIFFTYSRQLSPKLHLDLSAGTILSLQGSRALSDSSTGVTVNKFGAKACVRTQLRYQFSAWGVSLNTNFGYDFIPVNSWPGIERRRTYLDLGVGVHYVIGK